MFVGRFITSMDVSLWQDDRPDSQECTEMVIRAGLHFAETHEGCIAKMVEQFKAETQGFFEDDCTDFVFDKVSVSDTGVSVEFCYLDDGVEVTGKQSMEFSVVECKI